MKGAFSIDGQYYLLRQLADGVTINIFRTERFRKPRLVASFTSWKKCTWLAPVDDDTQSKLTGVVDGYRRMARFAKIGFLFNG